MRILQASPADPEAAIDCARDLRCEAVAWNLREPCGRAIQAATRAWLRSEGWLQVARDPEAAAAHPDWMHSPQHHEWLQRFPEFTGGHPALVGSYIGLNTRPAFDHALRAAAGRIRENAWVERIWLGDIQGPPMGCGCGNPCCRSWDNAPGEKIFRSAYENSTAFFSLEFYRSLSAECRSMGLSPNLVPVLCPECEIGIDVDGIENPDGRGGTNLCRGIPCVPCTMDYWPGLLRAFREEGIPTGLLLMVDALDKNHPIYGPPRAWAKRARARYGEDLIPCVEPEDAFTFDDCLVLTDAPQECRPAPPPAGYVPVLPPIMCGYHPPDE